MLTSRTLVALLTSAVAGVSAFYMPETANEGAAPAEETVTRVPLPKGKIEFIPFEEIKTVHNPRQPAMVEKNAQRLVPSIRDNGFIESQPLSVNRRKGEKGVVLLAGHSRRRALELLTPAERKEALSAHNGKVPCVVFDNLSPMGEQLVIAHDFTRAADKMPGDKWTDFNIVSDFIDRTPTGQKVMSDNNIAFHMGWISTSGKNAGKPNRNKALEFRVLRDMGKRVPEILEEYRKRWDTTLPDDQKATPLTDAMIRNELQQAYNVDATGAALRAKFDELMARGADESGNPNTPQRVLPAEARETAKGMKSTLGIRLVYALTRQPTKPGEKPETVDAVDAEIFALETAKRNAKPATPAKQHAKREHAKQHAK